jgi:DNA repair protein RadC
MNFQDIHPVDRPREKLAKLGPSRLTNAELLAILLNTGTKGKNVLELSQEILSNLTVAELFKLDLPALSKLSGLGQTKASLLLAAHELVNRAKPRQSFLPQVNEPVDALPLLKSLRTYKKEYLMVLYLNVKNEVIWQENISVGTVDFTVIHPREIFEPAIRYMASALILAHNHPSGDPDPSQADLEVTKQMMEVGRLMGIPVLDHIIVAGESYCSVGDQLMD